MEEELEDLKKVLQALVVSSPAQLDARTVLRDYRDMIGTHIPAAKFGYRDPITFLREQFADCFIGPAANPELTLIVTDNIKHVDKFVQNQKSSSITKFRGKRRSVPESYNATRGSASKPQGQFQRPHVRNGSQNSTEKCGPLLQQPHMQKGSAPHMTSPPIMTSPPNVTSPLNMTSPPKLRPLLGRPQNGSEVFQKKNRNIQGGNVNTISDKAHSHSNASHETYTSECATARSSVDRDYTGDDEQFGRLTPASSVSSGSRLQVKRDIREIIDDHPEGVWCTDLLELYKERFGRELNYQRFGYTSVLSLACTVERVAVVQHAARADWLLADAHAPAALAPPPPPPPRPAPRAPSPVDPEDALPSMPYEEEVFPADCMHFVDSIPGASLAGVFRGELLEVAVGEVYSPSHFWLLRLGEQHHLALERLMDDMNRYYESEGGARALAPGAVRVGHYCSSRYAGDWHRSLVVRLLDCDTVKVRHVDYGTVERVDVRGLRPLRREWAALPAQAVRARLAAVRPAAAGRRWQRAAAHHFLALVTDRPLVANVTAVDAQDAVLEVLLIDTATDEDVSISDEMVSSGHADPRPDSAIGTSECYLFPTFAALECGDTPNFAEIAAYLRDGIVLDFVDEYRRHVPPSLPPEQPPPPSASPPPCPPASPSLVPATPPPPAPLHNRVPLLLGADAPPQPKPCARLLPRVAPAAPPPPAPTFTPRCAATSAWGLAYQPFAPPQSAPGGVALADSDVETYVLLSMLDPFAAHRHMMTTLGRALAASGRLLPPRPAPLDPSGPVRPPPGFEHM